MIRSEFHQKSDFLRCLAGPVKHREQANYNRLKMLQAEQAAAGYPLPEAKIDRSVFRAKRGFPQPSLLRLIERIL